MGAEMVGRDVDDAELGEGECLDLEEDLVLEWVLEGLDDLMVCHWEGLVIR